MALLEVLPFIASYIARLAKETNLSPKMGIRYLANTIS